MATATGVKYLGASPAFSKHKTLGIWFLCGCSNFFFEKVSCLPVKVFYVGAPPASLPTQLSSISWIQGHYMTVHVSRYTHTHIHSYTHGHTRTHTQTRAHTHTGNRQHVSTRILVLPIGARLEWTVFCWNATDKKGWRQYLCLGPFLLSLQARQS